MAFVCPVHQLIALKPQLDLPLGLLHGVAGMDDIPADVDAEVSSDGAGDSNSRISMSYHGPRGADHIGAFPDLQHRDKGWEKWGSPRAQQL